MAKTAPRRFAPLKETPGQQQSHLPKLQGIIFDVDGTLCLPQNYMFAQMRAVLSIPRTTDILAHIVGLPTAAERETAMEAIRSIEREAMAAQVPQPGLRALMTYLQSQGIRKGICTRNFEQPVTHLLSKFLADVDFAPIVTRAFTPPKPDPAGLLFIARSWGLVAPAPTPSITTPAVPAPKPGPVSGVQPDGVAAIPQPLTTITDGTAEMVGDASALIMVGDSIDDMTAGRRAGAGTVLLVNGDNAHLAEHPHTDLVIQSLDELVGVLEAGFVGREISDGEAPVRMGTGAATSSG
ncbi:HAD-like protein [Nemania sp. FL0916]|nr:HAD-like protein [Nemania sp. FL0916]